MSSPGFQPSSKDIYPWGGVPVDRIGAPKKNRVSSAAMIKSRSLSLRVPMSKDPDKIRMGSWNEGPLKKNELNKIQPFSKSIKRTASAQALRKPKLTKVEAAYAKKSPYASIVIVKQPAPVPKSKSMRGFIKDKKARAGSGSKPPKSRARFRLQGLKTKAMGVSSNSSSFREPESKSCSQHSLLRQSSSASLHTSSSKPFKSLSGSFAPFTSFNMYTFEAEEKSLLQDDLLKATPKKSSYRSSAIQLEVDFAERLGKLDKRSPVYELERQELLEVLFDDIIRHDKAFSKLLMIVKAEFTSAIDSRSVDRNAKSSRFIEDMTRADVDPSTLPVKTTTKSSAKTFGGTRNHFNQQDATNTQNQRLSRENTRTAKKLAAFQEAYSKTFSELMDTKEEIVKIKLDNKKLAERLSELQSITTQAGDSEVNDSKKGLEVKQSSGHAKKWDEASRDELLAEVRYLNYHIAELQEDLLDSKERERDLLQKIKFEHHSRGASDEDYNSDDKDDQSHQARMRSALDELANEVHEPTGDADFIDVDDEYDSDAWSPPPTPPSGRPDFVPSLNFKGVALDPDESDEGDDEWVEDDRDGEDDEEEGNQYDYFAQASDERGSRSEDPDEDEEAGRLLHARKITAS